MHRDKLQHILQSGFGETINGAPSIIFLDTGSPQFTERVFEAHRNYIYKHSPRTTVISVAAEYRDRMLPYHPFLTMYNGYTHPTDYRGTLDMVMVPDLEALESVLKVNMTRSI